MKSLREVCVKGILVGLMACTGLLLPVAQAQDQTPVVPLEDAEGHSLALGQELRRAETAWKSGTSLLEAKARLDRVVEAYPDELEARTLRAQVLLSMNRPDEALADTRRAVELAPESGEAHLLLSEAARVSGDLDLARAELDRAAELLKEDAALHTRLSWNAALLGQLDRAEAFARVALALDDRSAAAYYQLARVFLLRGSPDQAVTVLERGFRASVLDTAMLAQDSLLVQVVDHPSLQPFIRQ